MIQSKRLLWADSLKGWVVSEVRILLPTCSDAVIVGLSFVLCLFLTFCIVEGLKKIKLQPRFFLANYKQKNENRKYIVWIR